MIRNKKNIVRGTQDPLTNEVHRLMIKFPYRWYSVQEVCMTIFNEYNKSHDTAIREAIRRVRLNADWFCIVVSGRRGYKVAESNEEYRAWRKGVIDTFNTDLDVLEVSDWKSMHNENLRMTDSEYECPVYESIKDAPPIPQLQPPIKYNIQTNGQVTMELS